MSLTCSVSLQVDEAQVQSESSGLPGAQVTFSEASLFLAFPFSLQRQFNEDYIFFGYLF